MRAKLKVGFDDADEVAVELTVLDEPDELPVVLDVEIVVLDVEIVVLRDVTMAVEEDLEVLGGAVVMFAGDPSPIPG